MARPIVRRKIKHAFKEAGIPKHWFNGSVVATHITNGVNLLFPAGERFFVRSVKAFEHVYKDDPKMKADVKAFFGQEGNHAREHERYFQILEDQGYDLSRFLAFYNWLGYEVFEKIAPKKLRLSTTAAAEHFTAIMAEQGLTYRWLEGVAPDVITDLMLWHAVEEIEHRSVAFDVLQRVDDDYWLRVAGMAVATVMLSSFWMLGSASLIRQDGISLRQVLAELRESRKSRRAATGDAKSSIGRDVFLKGIREYLERDFHPDNNTRMDALADAYIKERGLKTAGGSAQVA